MFMMIAWFIFPGKELDTHIIAEAYIAIYVRVCVLLSTSFIFPNPPFFVLEFLWEGLGRCCLVSDGLFGSGADMDLSRFGCLWDYMYSRNGLASEMYDGTHKFNRAMCIQVRILEYSLRSGLEEELLFRCFSLHDVPVASSPMILYLTRY
jgi:hypothetical protein